MAEEAPSGGERTEAPTAKRRNDFREKGQVAQSKEIHTAALLTFSLALWFFYMPSFFLRMTDLIAHIWRSSGTFDVTPNSLVALAAFIVKNIAWMLAPLFVLVMIVGFFSSVLQFGWLLTGKPLIPDISKLDPIKGFGRLFSKRSLVEVVKSLAKISLIAWLAYSTVINHIEEALILIDTAPISAIVYIGKMAVLILAKVCALLILLAFIDFLYTQYEMEEKMKMTKQEVKEEHKETEGDPRIKSQIRSIQQEMARKRMMAEVPKADVVITNPTHLAVAVKYVSGEMDAPVIIAKGQELIAMKIREIARDHNVPIVENPPVARMLHKLDLGATIPESLFKAVAEILAHVYSLKGIRP
jgi:flagellar biosynthesis protein FlhB